MKLTPNKIVSNFVSTASTGAHEAREENANRVGKPAPRADAHRLSGPLDGLRQRDPERQEAAATALQAAARGVLARRQVSVRGDGNGLVTVNIHGGSEVFEKTGFDQQRSAYPKTLHYKAGDASDFEVNVVGGDRVHEPFTRSGAKLRGDLFGGTRLEHSEGHAVVNGTFYNQARFANGWQPSHASIGQSQTLTKPHPPAAKIPDLYKGDYSKLDFGETSLHTAPQLSENGVPTFGNDQLRRRRYQFGYGGNPGELDHASHPNPRSGVSLPAHVGYGANSLPNDGSEADASNGKHDAIRLASVTSPTRGANSHGMTMPEFSRAMARLDRMNQTTSETQPSRSFNLDGGGSLYNAKLDANGNKEEMEVPGPHNGAPNYVAISKKVDGDNSGMSRLSTALRFLRVSKKSPMRR
jgi:hypothetical protein